MAVKIQLRGDTKANWLLANPVISEREIVLETDTGKYKIGDGVAHYADLSYHGIDGKSSRITTDGFWEIYDQATDTYVKTDYKAIGVDGKSAFELWQALEGNADKTLIDFFVYLKGEKGDAFTFDDFTIEQLALLKGASAYQVWKAQDGNEDKTVDEYLQYIKGAPFTYADFTPEQIIAITGKSAYQIWLDQPGNEGKTVEEYLIAIKGQDGQSAYLDAVAKGYTGTKDEFDTLLAGIRYNVEFANTPQLALEWLSAKDQGNELSSYAIKLQLDIYGGFDKLWNLIDTQALWVNGKSDYHYLGGIGTSLQFGGILIFDQVSKETANGWRFIYINTRCDAAPHRGQYCKLILIDKGDDKDMYTRYDMSYSYKWVDPAEYGLVVTDVKDLISLSSLSDTKYSQKYTYTSTTAQGINFASVPAEGFECLVSIKNGTSSQITQAIPNAAAWQCEETSLVIPAGKIGFISIQYIHGIYCVRVGL